VFSGLFSKTRLSPCLLSSIIFSISQILEQR
jgi:hypothetical protein